MTWRNTAGWWVAGALAALASSGCLELGSALQPGPAPKPAAPKPRTGAAAAAPTFSEDVAPIVFGSCASCHRPGEVAPFSLLSYQDTKKRARQIAQVTAERRMPPWKADSHGEFQNERRLTQEQIDTLKRWADAGAPEGRREETPQPPKFAEGWQLSTPDAVFEPAESYTLGADGQDVYGCFVIPTKYEEDRYVSAVEVRPGNRTVVHHVLIFLDSTGTARKLDEAEPGPGYTRFGGVGFTPTGGLGGWAPGMTPTPLPQGIGQVMPKGSDIVLQVHYHKSGKPETDRTRIGVHFAKGPVTKRARSLPLAYRRLRIPPGDSRYEVTTGFPISMDVSVRSVTPHMHLLGKEMTVTATLPDGRKKQLVRAPDWDFNWQIPYTFKEPVKLPRGSRLDLVAAYDNSEKNPRNPSRPPRVVMWGEQTTDEMCIAFIGFTVDQEDLTRPGRGILPLLQRLRQQ